MSCQGDFRDIAEHALCGEDRLFNISSDFLGGGALLADRDRDARGYLVDLTGRAADTVAGTYGFTCGVLQSFDLDLDILGRFCGLRRQTRHLRGDNREFYTCISGPGCLDGRVQGK